MISSLLQNHSLCIYYIIDLQLEAPVKSVACSSPFESCVRRHHFSEEFCVPEVGEELVCLSTRRMQSKRHVRSHRKPDATKAVQIKCNSDLSSFQLHFITNFILTELASSNLFTPEGVGCICAFWQGSLCCDVYVKGKDPKIVLQFGYGCAQQSLM